MTSGQPPVSSEAPAPAPPPAPEAAAVAPGPLERPEVLVGAAFAAGLVVAFVLRRITS